MLFLTLFYHSKTMAFFDAVQRKEDEHQHAMIRSKIGGMVWQVKIFFFSGLIFRDIFFNISFNFTLNYPKLLNNFSYRYLM